MKKFTIAFLLGLAACLIASIACDIYQSDGIDTQDAVMRYGFPFLYQTDGDYSDRYFSFAALVADIVVAVILSALAAIIYLKCSRNMPPDSTGPSRRGLGEGRKPTPKTPSGSRGTSSCRCFFVGQLVASKLRAKTDGSAFGR
jgi:hypothetical protein